MAKNSIRDYSATASSNTDIQSIDIDENCAASGINNAIREVMADLKDVSVGTVALESPKFDSILDGNIKATDASGTDTAGTATTIKGGAGTGTGAGGSIIFQVADGAGSTGSSVNAHATAMTITDDGSIDINGNELILDADGDTKIAASTDDVMTFDTAGSERCRVDASGNLLVGKTSATLNTEGHALAPTYARFTRNGAAPVQFNRTASDGDIALFYKDGTTVGNIRSSGTTLAIGSDGGGGGYLQLGSLTQAFFVVFSGAIYPEDDNLRDLGLTPKRFDDIYATNGTIITSDANEKQQIASLTAAEITAAKAISKLFKTFKWNSAVEAKGDAARTHTGVIAQQVETAMTDAGLDAGDYAFFISSTWWETQTEVPAVEAVAEVLDDDGNVVTEAVEAVDAYIRTDTYDTAEEAPEGATERTRLGIRYPELLAFVGAATEQRLADIETRLTALENA